MTPNASKAKLVVQAPHGRSGSNLHFPQVLFYIRPAPEPLRSYIDRFSVVAIGLTAFFHYSSDKCYGRGIDARDDSLVTIPVERRRSTENVPTQLHNLESYDQSWTFRTKMVQDTLALTSVINIRSDGSEDGPAPYSRNRKRRWHSKVATGCLKCKERRISR